MPLDAAHNHIQSHQIFSALRDDDICETIDRKIKSAKALKAVGETLTDREREIICYRYGIFGYPVKTQREIAELLGISRSYVSRIEKLALKKLEKALI